MVGIGFLRENKGREREKRIGHHCSGGSPAVVTGMVVADDNFGKSLEREGKVERESRGEMDGKEREVGSISIVGSILIDR